MNVRIRQKRHHCAIMVMMAATASAQGLDEAARIETLLQQLSMREKVSLMSGASSFGTVAIERLGIHSMRFADGPNGVRSNDGDETTAFPAGILLASSWNRQLAQDIGRAIGEETRASGSQVLLAPNLNLVRSPLAGRNFETYGEDPLLVGELGVQFVRGVQSVGIAASPKHYVGNEQETERVRGNTIMDARTLHELYLKPFEMVTQQAHPWSFMTAYNRTNGVFMSEHTALIEQLKQGWGFDGVLMSDWGGTQSTAAARAGLDLEMPGPSRYFGDLLINAVRVYEVAPERIDDAARRMLQLGARVGSLDSAAPSKVALTAKPMISTSAHRNLARQAAAQGITLLKNDAQALPLDPSALRTLAVIGPNADAVVMQGGGSAAVTPSNLVSPLDAIRSLLGGSTHITHEPGVENERATPFIDGRALSTTRTRTKRGWLARYYANDKFAGPPAKTRIEQTLGGIMLANDVNLQGGNNLSAQWQGYYWPTRTGPHEFELEQFKAPEGSTLASRNSVITAQLSVNGSVLIHPGVTPTSDPPAGFFPSEVRRATVNLQAGRGYPIAMKYSGRDLRMQYFHLAVRAPGGSIDAAVQAARQAEAAVVLVGSGTTTESEGRDRDSLELSEPQQALIRAVAAANPRTIVVLNNGGPVSMAWAPEVKAIVEAWLPGQEGALALADILFGRINPSGKLPVSFPQRLQDSPSYPFFPGAQNAYYGESLFMGYRYYDKKQVEPLFPFGHGLSYTSFEYSNLRIPARDTEDTVISVDIRNSGTRQGTEVVQLYVTDQHCVELCPVRELKAFERVDLPAGATRTVELKVSAQSLQRFDVATGKWQTTPGRYTIAVGSSSRDLRLHGEVQ